MCYAHFHSLCIVECAALNLSATAMTEPLLRQSSEHSHQQHGDHLQVLIICQIHFGWVTTVCLLVRGILIFHCPLKPVLQTLTLFSLLFLWL